MKLQKIRRSIAIIAAPLLLVAGLSACASNSESAPDTETGASEVTVRLGWLKSTADLAAYVAEDNAPEGVTIESSLFTTAVDVQTALVTGQIDVGMLTPVHLLRAAENGDDLVQISGNTRGNSGVMLSSELGLEEEDWDGLKAILKDRKLKIAASRGSINEALGILEFAEHGIDVNEDIELINITNFAQHAEGIRLGEFDGAFTMETFASIMAADGTATFFSKPYNSPAGDINTIFVANKTWVNENPEAAQAFVQTIANSAEKLGSDPDYEIEVGMELMGLDRSIIEAALSNNRYEIEVGLEETRALAEVQHKLGILSRDLTGEIDEYVTDEFVNGVTG